MRSDRLKRHARDALVNGWSSARSRTTSRETLLALAEYARRWGGDTPPIPADARLDGYELRVFSQNGEDGVLAEILRRAGVTNRWFVEFGAGNGLEATCLALADVMGWSGLFIESGARHFERLGRKYAANPRVVTVRASVDERNVEALFERGGVPIEPDVVSIDIDGGDYWVWLALQRWRPRVLIIEYNSGLGGELELVQPRDRAAAWDRTEYFGASIGAMCRLGTEKSYRLVHAELTGANAFFVRDDVDGLWPEPGDVTLRGPNYFLSGARHDPDPHGRRYVTPPRGEAP